MMRSLARLWVPFILVLLLPASAWPLTIEEIGADGLPGEDGGSAFAQGSELANDSGLAQVSGRATGGAGGPADALAGLPAGDGGRANVDLYGASDTGTVLVDGSAWGGAGGGGILAEDIPAGDGAPVWLWNAVDGDTAGVLSLTQTAIGGNSGTGAGGKAGAATSWLAHRKAAGSFTLVSSARGGGPGISPIRQLSVTAGAPATAFGSGTNTAGPMRVRVNANGGFGGSRLGFPGQPGGDARVFAYGRTEGDDHPVFVGAPVFGPFPFPPPAPTSSDLGSDIIISPLPVPFFEAIGAVGGGGGAVARSFLPSVIQPGGDGGDGRSVSIGVAEGDSEVHVRDVARGGHAGRAAAGEDPALGGDARSQAVGVGRGTAPVAVESEATGGASGVPSLLLSEPLPDLPAVPGGRAVAHALGFGRGPVNATATAVGGTGSPQPFLGLPGTNGGPARATATGIGAEGAVAASAWSSTSLLQLGAHTQVSVLERATVQAEVGPERWRRGRGFAVGTRDARTRTQVTPDASQVGRVLAGARELREALEAAGADDFHALGSWTVRPRQGRRGDEVTSVLEVRLDNRLIRSASGDYFIGLSGGKLRRVGFERLRVTLERLDDVLFDETFHSVRGARAFLDGALLEVGEIPFQSIILPPGGFPAGAVRLRVELVTGSRAAGLDLDFVVARAAP